MMYVPDQMMIRTDADKKCYIYETEPLIDETEITGHPVVNLWLSSNRKDGDIFVYLTDVDNKGNSLYVTEGQLRAGWKNLYDDNDQVLGKFDMQPDLPWHGYRGNQFINNVFKDGKPVSLKFDLFPTSWLFKKGHRIRIAIAGADNKNFEMNPSLCSDNIPETCIPTTINIHRSKKFSSFIELPVIP
jgi:putative CocE/NonD family hydrolase